jgi:nucleoside-diphosphate-sugar epimerase
MSTMTLPAWVVMILAEIADRLRQVGVTIPLEGNQLRMSTRMVFFNCQKAWRELGEPKISIQQSLKETYAWYKAHGDIP